MKEKKKTGRSLESFAVFPYIAWGLTILFALFVYNITIDLKETATRLQTQADSLEAKVNMPVDQIEDFSI